MCCEQLGNVSARCMSNVNEHKKEETRIHVGAVISRYSIVMERVRENQLIILLVAFAIRGKSA